MKEDDIDYGFFLTMLSVERTGPFISELSLPFEQEIFPKVMAFCRACLEVRIFQSLDSYNKFPNYIELWHKYRSAESIIPNKELMLLSQCDRNLFVISECVYTEFPNLISPSLRSDLEDWFLNDFRSTVDPIWQWPWALRLFFIEDNLKGQINHSSFSYNEEICIKTFSKRYEEAKKNLELRFIAIEKKAKLSRPSDWETVLLSFPPDEGTLRYYPWLMTIRDCLYFRLIRSEWDKLRRELGCKKMEQLLNWVKENSRFLPWNTVLPDPPKPVE